MTHPTLQYLSGDKVGRILQVMPQHIYIFGREPSCDISVPEAKVSRKHAQVSWNPESRQLVLEDLKSTNGTLLNGVSLHQAVALKTGDRIQVGTLILLVKVPDAEREQTFTLQKEVGKPDDDDLFATPSTDILSLESLDESPAGANENSDLSPASSHNDKQHPFDSGYETDGVAVTGNLREMHLPDLLQMLANTRKTGKLVVVPQRSQLSSNPSQEAAVLWLNQGLLVAAFLGHLNGEKAFYELLKWQQGYFALYYKEPPPQRNQITQPLEVLLLEGLRHLDEEKSLSVSLNPEDILEVNPEAPLNLLEPDQLRLFQIAWKNKKIAQIWQASHLGLDETNDALKRLLRGGYLKKANS